MFMEQCIRLQAPWQIGFHVEVRMSQGLAEPKKPATNNSTASETCGQPKRERSHLQELDMNSQYLSRQRYRKRLRLSSELLRSVEHAIETSKRTRAEISGSNVPSSEPASFPPPVSGELSWLPSVEDIEASSQRLQATNTEAGCTDPASVFSLDTNSVHDRRQEEPTCNEGEIRAETPAECGKESKAKLREFEPSGLCLNQLDDVEAQSTHRSLQELLSPIEDVQEVFVATFTADVLWFLSSCSIPKDLPVTVACHHNQKCWSASVDDRSEEPYAEWPNVTLVYPLFPTLRRTNDKVKMRGIGCHHPKLFILKRNSSLRVIVTSANLNYRQWRQISNTVWWQDFPLQQQANYAALFRPSGDLEVTAGDFSAQLATFVSSLVKDTPSAHWVVDLAYYDFSKAGVSLVASIPGIHALPVPQPSLDVSKPSKYLGAVSTSVVGISHWFRSKADPNGARLRDLAASFNKIARDAEGMIHVLLRRAKSVPADPNAVTVSVILGPDVKALDQASQAGLETECVQLGFLPRTVAKWVAPLCDGGICSFSARLWPDQVLPVAAGQSKDVVRLELSVAEGCQFSMLDRKCLSTVEANSLSALIGSVQRYYGIWRLEEILSKHKWPDSAEKDFVYCSSSIGTSLNSSFLASFSAATGRKAISGEDTESDPEWGCWTAQHEQAKPSLKVVFPTLARVKDSKWGPSSYRGILCFSEKTWERLKSTRLLHDAIPSTDSRAGVPMHLKVARRRFQLKSSKRSFGWIYSGSHNFSPAAWGKCVRKAADATSRLHICNYELGIIFLEPPPTFLDDGDSKCQRQRQRGLDDIPLPFLVPPPSYSVSDKAATQTAIRKLVEEMDEEEKSVLNECGENEGEITSEVEVEGRDWEDDASSGTSYAEALWDQTT